MPDLRHATHGDVPPLINDSCHTLVLGSMLSPKSAEAKFYYAHPQNRFWRVLSAVFDAPYADTTEKRAELALSNGIALWDVLHSCDINGAADSTIKNAVYNDIHGLISSHPSITRVFTAGGKAFELLQKYNLTAKDKIIAAAIKLPSTSPLNCAASLDALIAAYKILKA